MDERSKPEIPQIVFYQSGIGSEKNLYSEYIQGINKFLHIAIYFEWHGCCRVRNDGKFSRSVVRCYTSTLLGANDKHKNRQ